MKNIIYLIIITLTVFSCKKEDQYLPPVFNYPIPQVDITSNVIAGAFYYNYVAADWAKKYTYTPQLGEYNALTASVMAQHRAWADAGGIDFLTITWDGTIGDPLLTSFVTGRNENVKLVINYNTAHLKATNAAALVGAKLTTMLSEFKTLSANHFTKGHYFTINGNPVVMITPINLLTTAAASIDYVAVVAALKADLKLAGITPFIIAEITSGWLAPQRYSTVLKSFDAVVLSNWTCNGNYGYDRSVFYPAFTDESFRNWKDSTTVWGNNFVPCISPGFDDKVMTPASKNFNLERSTQFYIDNCNVAKRNMGTKRIVMINSWNNFQYGTTIEPTKEYGLEYLNITKSQFKLK